VCHAQRGSGLVELSLRLMQPGLGVDNPCLGNKALRGQLLLACEIVLCRGQRCLCLALLCQGDRQFVLAAPLFGVGGLRFGAAQSGCSLVTRVALGLRVQGREGASFLMLWPVCTAKVSNRPTMGAAM